MPVLPSFPYSLPPLSSAPVYGSVLQKRLRSEGSRQPFRYQMPACVPPSQPRPRSDLPACTSNFCATLLQNVHPLYLSIPPPGSRLHTSSDISRLQCRIHLNRVSLGLYADQVHPALVKTGSWVRSRTSRAGSSGYSVSFLVMRSSALIIVVALP